MIIIQFGVFPPPSLGLVGSEMKGVFFLLLLCFIFQMGLEKTQVAARNLSRSQGERDRTLDWVMRAGAI